MVGYKAEGAVEWMDVEVTLNTSSQVFSIAGIENRATTVALMPLPSQTCRRPQPTL